MAWDEGLEPGPAREFAAASDPILRALAGPGTGKSFAIRRRVARLLEEEDEPDSIFVVTFTRTAAQDLVANLEELGEPAVADIAVRTLHAFCFSMLGREGVLRATRRVPRIALEFEADLLLRDLPDTFGTLTAKRQLRQDFEAAWARGQSDAPGAPVAGLDQAFQDALLATLRWHRGMLIGEVVPISLSYLRHNPEADERRRFRHVLVDEYQDLNRAEQVVIDLLAGRNLAVIGDDDQSIYGFKSANPEGIRTFANGHPGTRDIEFQMCRRCPQTVVRMAETLIRRNPDRARMALLPRPENPVGEIHHAQWRSMEDEAAGIARFIAHKVAAGIDPGRCLVLAPLRKIGYALRDAVAAEGIEIRSFFREEAVEATAAQEALTLLTLLGDPEDRLALRAWLGFGSTTHRVGPYRRVQAAAGERASDVASVLRAIVDGSLLVPHVPANSGLIERWHELERRRAELGGLSEDLRALVDRLLPEPTGACTPDNEEIAVLRAIAQGAAGEAGSLSELPTMIRYRISQPEVPLETPYARVMSFHKSKGLTADLVVLAGLTDGLMPRLEADVSREEQRRLFFVGLTRTTRVLVLSTYSQLQSRQAHAARVRQGQHLGGGNVRVFASQFLDELGPALPAAVRGTEWNYV